MADRRRSEMLSDRLFFLHGICYVGDFQVQSGSTENYLWTNNFSDLKEFPPKPIEFQIHRILFFAER